jgi:negative regulator of replication initiation
MIERVHATDKETAQVIVAMKNKIESQEKAIEELVEHLGEALYSDEWDTREYAIVAHSRYKKGLL